MTPLAGVRVAGVSVLVVPSSWTAPHHVVHWSHGGDADLDNLVRHEYEPSESR
jgi:hypothetical protein